jgi:catalase-peroxidase
MVPDAHIKGKMNKPMMLTTDLALRFGDDNYKLICEKFLADFDYFSDVFAKAWFKLTHRDMGPKSRYLGREVPSETFLWQDPVHKNNYPPLTDKDVYSIKQNILHELPNTDITIDFTWGFGGMKDTRPLDIRDLVFTAWVSASTYRDTDRRGGANGARILLEPMKSWRFVDYERVEKTLGFLRQIADSLNIQISNADLIVLGGSAAIEKAALNAGYSANVPFVGGRGDATQDQVDVESFAYLEPVADGFLNWTHHEHNFGSGFHILDQIAEHLLVERSALLSLTIPEMVALLIGFRAMSVHHRESDISSQSWNRKAGHKLNKDFLENALLKQWYKWTGTAVGPIGEMIEPDEKRLAWRFAGQHYVSDTMIQASRVDMFISSNSILRSVAEVFCGDDGNEILIKNFIQAWVKVMNADRFDLR